MRITFLLTGPAEKPIGGYKVIYEYANRLANDGYDVTILYPLIMKPRGSGFKLLLKQIYLMFFGIKDFFKYRKTYTPISWFSLEKTVKEKLIWSLSERNVPESDIYIASYYT
ncbi:hypothetical protein, partial [uncultured Flavobacterium sp.]|uniref:hypothetical protein n=1 Tax=uncultured Flavobacterium sp. TaxID=165435 RepID=UPI0025D4FF81